MDFNASRDVPRERKTHGGNGDPKNWTIYERDVVGSFVKGRNLNSSSDGAGYASPSLPTGPTTIKIPRF